MYLNKGETLRVISMCPTPIYYHLEPQIRPILQFRIENCLYRKACYCEVQFA